MPCGLGQVTSGGEEVTPTLSASKESRVGRMGRCLSPQAYLLVSHGAGGGSRW